MRKLTLLSLSVVQIIAASAQIWTTPADNSAWNFLEVESAFHAWHGPQLVALEAREAPANDVERLALKQAERLYKQWMRARRHHVDAEGWPLTRAQEDERVRAFHGTVRQGGGGGQTAWTAFGPTVGTGVVGLGVLSAIGFSTTDPDRLYVGSWLSGIWRSDDQGNSWVPLLDSLAAWRTRSLAVDPGNDDRVVALCHDRLLRTSNAGASWTGLNTGVTLGISDANKIQYDAMVPGRLLLSGIFGLLESLDHGDTWTQLHSGLLWDLEMKPGSANVLYAFTSNSALGSGNPHVLRSTDGGLSFDTVATFAGNNGNKIAGIAVTPADPERLFVFLPGPGADGTQPGQLARSLDGGDSFQLLPTSNLLRGFFYPNPIAVSPTDPDRILAGDIFLRYSNDGGLTWAPCHGGDAGASNYMHVDHRAVDIRHGIAWSCNDGGLYSSTDDGASWTDRTANMKIGHVTDHDRSLTDTTVWAMGQNHNGCSGRVDGVWREYSPGDGFNVAVNPVDPLHMLGTNPSGNVRVTFDGGESFVSAQGITGSQTGYEPNRPLVFNQQRPQTVYTIRTNVFRSTNGGLNWAPLSAFPTGGGGGILLVHPLDSNIILTTRWRSSDHGATWQTFANPLGNVLTFGAMAQDANDPARVWAASFSGPVRVFQSSDTANTWTEIPSSDLPPGRVRSLLHVNNGFDALYLTCDAGVFYRDNQLSNWQPFGNGLPYCPLYDIQHHPLDGKLSLSTYGRGIWLSDGFTHDQPPVADLLAVPSTVCPGQLVQFYDNSLNNGPGYNAQYLWSFPGGIPATSTEADPVVSYATEGEYTVSLLVVNDNGTDSISYTSLVNVTEPVVPPPYSEGFEDPAFPPTGWTQRSNIVLANWQRSTHPTLPMGGYGASLASTSLISYPHGLAPAALLTPSMELDAPANWALIYDRAYRPHTEPLRWDTLHVFYTLDCGDSRSSLLLRGGEALSTAPPTTAAWNPDSTTWTSDTLQLTGLPAFMPLQFGFEVITQGSMSLFLDNVRVVFLGTTGLVTTPPGKGITVVPNPAAESVIVFFGEHVNGILLLEDHAGRVLRQYAVAADRFALELGGVPSGLYVLRLAGNKRSTRLMVTR